MVKAKKQPSETAGLDGLQRYKEKRDFTKTPEPDEPAAKRSKKASGGQLRYLIQKHAASRLHYDFRLELDGVLKSWAVPKGPSADPEVKRLAVRTEDHPLAYGDFEGIIPKGEYGGGTVMLWDVGSWEPVEDAHRGLEKGHLKCALHGKRLQGTWNLVRLPRDKDEKENWLLVKSKDDTGIEVETGDEDISIVSGRKMDAIAAGSDVWHSSKPKLARGASRSAPQKAATSKLPAFVPPQLATLASEPPEGKDWLHEIKYDGYRLMLAIGAGDIRAYTRSGHDWTAKFGEIITAAEALDVQSALIDGEAIALDTNQRSNFSKMRSAMERNRGADAGELAFVAFDLLELNGEDLRSRPLIDRKAALANVLRSALAPLSYSDHILGGGDTVLKEACRLELEGVISKRCDDSYRSGRGKSWLKSKCGGRREFIIAGFRKSSIAKRPFKSLILAELEDGTLLYRGRVGTGFDDDLLEDLADRFQKLKIDISAVSGVPKSIARDVIWLRPELIAEIRYTEQLASGVLRHPSFLGLREDKAPKDVTAEKPLEKTKPKPQKAPPPPLTTSVKLTSSVKLTNPGRVLYPGDGITKQHLADYLLSVADVMLPYAANRPLSLVRCPDGWGAKCFFQKHRVPGFPREFHTIPIMEKNGGTDDYIYIDSADGLVAAAQMGVLELHVWGASITSVEKPDRVVFDLDPDEAVSFREVSEAAIVVRDLLEAAGLKSFPLLTGGKGVHVIAPLGEKQLWDIVKSFAEAVARAMEKAEPKRFIAKASKAARKGKIFVDWLRNERGATVIAPYSPRSREHATVAMPVSWQELGEITTASAFTVRNACDHIRNADKPWRDYFDLKQSISNDALAVMKTAT